jgi:hypothetical protein
MLVGEGIEWWSNKPNGGSVSTVEGWKAVLGAVDRPSTIRILHCVCQNGIHFIYIGKNCFTAVIGAKPYQTEFKTKWQERTWGNKDPDNSH